MVNQSKKTRNQKVAQQVVVELPIKMTVAEFAEKINVSLVETVKKLIRNNHMLSASDQIDLALAIKVANEFGVSVKKPQQTESAVKKTSGVVPPKKADNKNFNPKPPVVTVMGHIDHGKTTLLDAIRGSSVAGKEAGGITQRIGAYQIDYKGQLVTFIDTPGHEMFTAMRSNGVQATDIALIVIAADDGIKPQTIEAINHVRVSNAIMMIAISKTDVPGADPEKIKFDLASHDVLVEPLGGDVLVNEVSAHDKTGINELIESINLVAELNEIKADYDGEVAGGVIEAYVDKFRGTLATVVLNSGTLRKGDHVVIGLEHGRVRSIVDENNNQLKELPPGKPAQIMGLSGLPEMGGTIQTVPNEAKAKGLIKVRQSMKQRQNTSGRLMTMDDVRRIAVQSKDSREIKVILKAMTSGMLDALQKTIENKATPELKIQVISASVGQVSVSDVLLASVSNSLIIGFGVTLETSTKRQIAKSDVPIRIYSIIYRLIEDVENGFKDLIGEEEKEVMVGKAFIKQIFPYGNSGKIAGIQVTEGEVTLNARVKIMHGDDEIYNGYLTSMRHLKKEVSKLNNQQEGGVSIKEFTDFAEGDEIGFYEVRKVSQ